MVAVLVVVDATFFYGKRPRAKKMEKKIPTTFSGFPKVVLVENSENFKFS